MVLGFVLFSDLILKVMSTKAYYAATGVSAILFFSSLFRGLYCFAVSPLFFKKKTYLIPIITLGAGAASVALNIWAIPKWGITGAAWVTVFSYFLTFVISEAFARRIFPLIYPWKKIVIVSGLALIVLAAMNLLRNALLVNYPIVLTISVLAMVAFVLVSLTVQDRHILTKLLQRVIKHA